jgi:DNA-binding NarL/FixJ family response regulator
MGAHDDWSGFLIDVELGMVRGNRFGLDVLAAARRVFPSVPAALVTASTEKEVINRAATLSATFLCKPFGPQEIAAFLERVTAADAGIDERLEGRLSSLARRWELAPRETDILAWLLAGRTRENYLARTGTSPLMWRVQVGRLLKKAGAARTSDLVANVLRDEARALARTRT